MSLQIIILANVPGLNKYPLFKFHYHLTLPDSKSLGPPSHAPDAFPLRRTVVSLRLRQPPALHPNPPPLQLFQHLWVGVGSRM